MFSRTGTLRPEDQDGENDPPVEPIPVKLVLTTETGVPLTDENGNELTITQ